MYKSDNKKHLTLQYSFQREEYPAVSTTKHGNTGNQYKDSLISKLPHMCVRSYTFPIYFRKCIIQYEEEFQHFVVTFKWISPFEDIFTSDNEGSLTLAPECFAFT